MKQFKGWDSAALLFASVNAVASHVKARVITSDAGYLVGGEAVSDGSG